MPLKPYRSLLHRFFLDTWYRKRWWAWLLLPLSWVFQILAAINTHRAKRQQKSLSVPVVVIGNISVGGTGKTPVIIALANALQKKGVSVGVISRGYGSQAPCYPYTVKYDDKPSITGDEPLLIARSANCPVVIGHKRIAAGEQLLKEYPQTQLILSDDGLQHYRLGRDKEFVVIDAQRGLGNHFCLPAGPLREPARRLASVDWILLNGQSQRPEAEALTPVELQPVAWRHVASNTLYDLTPLPWPESPQAVVAIAGIGHPQRFFNSVASLGIQAQTVPMEDHYVFSADDFREHEQNIILMTDKDAVKCRDLVHEQCWSLVVDMQLPEDVIDDVMGLLTPQG